MVEGPLSIVDHVMHALSRRLSHEWPPTAFATWIPRKNYRPRALWDETCAMAHRYRNHDLMITKGITNKKVGLITPSSNSCRGSPIRKPVML